MQSVSELAAIISKGRPDISHETIASWCACLVQLQGCHLFSVAAPELDQAEWLRERKAGIGGSEIASILGDNHWSSPRQVWMSKVGMFDDKPQPQSEAARWGNLLETQVATEWGIREKRNWIHIPVILQSDMRSYLLANIDGFTLADDGKTVTGILEIKTTSAYNKNVWEIGPLPDNYMHQVNWYCGITGLAWYDIVCLVGGQKLYSKHMPAESERFAKQVAAADDFWNNYVIPCKEPEATETDKVELSKTKVDVEKPITIFTDDSVENLADAYCKVREKISALKSIQDALHAQLMVALGNAPAGITKTHTLTYTKTARRSCNFDKLAELYPDAFDDCVDTSISQTLRIE